MRQSTTKILGTQKNILALAGELFQNTNIKVNKTDATLTEGVLLAGTIVDKTGKKIDGTTVTSDNSFGIVYEDVDFTNSSGTEIVPVTIFGFVKESTLPEDLPIEVKASLPMIKFL